MAMREEGFVAVRERLERRVLPYVLWLSAGIYSLLKFVDSDLKLEGWEFPLILVTLAVVLHLADLTRTDLLAEFGTSRRAGDGVAKRLDDMALALRNAERDLDDIKGLMSDGSNLRVFDSADEYFKSLRIAVEQANSRLWVCYVRERPPEQQGDAAREYFSYCDQWVKQPGHSMRRVVFVRPDNHEMKKWLLGERRKTANPAAHYQIRMRPETPKDKISVGLIDDKLIFCSFAGDRDDIQGFSLENARLVQHFRAYFSRMWDMAEVPGEGRTR
ncbi:hypothetical protein ACQPZX_25715 [Actinoplanes sp. CA-142083]|uniref:hypothetical protein n=1 Tax=Actinoplanes sp. CA-142083 TaxID=3239903 RepID=UPI003D8D8EBA